VYGRGKKTNYEFYTNQKSNSKFTGKTMEFSQQYRAYIDMHDHKEKYEIILPVLSLHNLIIGTTYLDIGGSSTVNLIGSEDLKCSLKFTKRGWLSKDEYKVEGEVSRVTSSKKNELLYKIHGNWNSKIYVTPYEKGSLNNSKTELVFEKAPYPEKWEYMYGLSHFSLQLNYLPSWLKSVVAPTDTRRRPD
jgi:hypothetical protein